MARPWRLIQAALSVALTAMVAAPRLAAQQRLGGYRLGPDGEPAAPAMGGSAPSAFALFSGADNAVSALFTVGYFNRTCLDNIALADIDASGCGPFFQLLPGDVFQAEWFRSLNVMWGVPPGDWNRAKALVPSLANARGAGWTVSDWHQTGLDDTGPLDGSLGLLHSGATTTSDGSCRDHRNAFAAGVTLLAGSNCPPTWGSAGWIGARPVPPEVWEDRFRSEGSAFRFDFWRVPDVELDAAGLERPSTIGDFQAYGVITDANRDILAGTSTIRSFGNVVPGGSGAPARPGWPLGLDVRVDAFSFRQVALADVAFYQAVIVNNSRRVYGVGLDYDSLYFAIGHGWFSDISQDYVYDAPELGAIIGHSGTMYPCALSREVSDVTCSRVGGVGAALGNRRGKAAIVVLRSPIGDLRNKWFTRPGSPFYDPASPAAGDTITFNHHHMCGFRACDRNTFATDPAIPDHERRAFGMLSSTEANVLGTRSAVSLTDQVFWHTFRSYGFPSRTGSQYFNRYVPPGNWDYDHDGVRDTLFLDMCRSPNGCSVRFSDTTVNGKMGAYSNTGAVLGVGPIRLRAGDTTAFVIALTSAADTAGLVENVMAAIAAYMDFYPRAVAPPPGRIVGTEAAAPAAGGVRLVWDETAERSAGGLLERESRNLLAAAAGSPAGKLLALNPWLADTLAYLATHALARVHVFKSCDDGRTWTRRADCRGDSVTAGPYASVGWLPYASLPADTAGDAPNTFADRNVAAGHTYTYALVTEAREVRLPVVRGDSVVAAGGGYRCVRGCRAEILEVQAASFSGLGTRPGDPGVARVYVPASTQAGARAAVLAVTDSAGPMPSSRLGLTVLVDTVVPGQYRVRFGAQALAVRRTFGSPRHPDSVLTRVALLDGATTVAVLTGRNAGGYAVSGGTTVTALLAGLSVDTTRFATGPVLLVSRFSGAAEEPLLISATLTGVEATPAAFYGLSEFPGFALAVDARLAGTFDAQAYVTAAGDTVRVLVEPAVTWLVDAAQRRSGGAGDYVVTWAASAFGPGEPFALDLPARQQTAATVRASLEARAVAAFGITGASAAAAIATALGRSITAESLVAVRLPFAVRNASYARGVSVAMLRRPDDTVVLGNGADTLRVAVPADAWVPGDRLILLEPDSAGAPDVTWTTAVIGCDPVRWTRTSCNPLRLRSTGATGWLGPLAGMRLRVRYHVPATSRSTFTVRADAPLRGSALARQPDSVRAGLAAIRVVPNPYLIVSQLPGSGILFTHLPPRGVLRLYSVSGTPLFTVRWDEAVLGRSGDFRWLLKNSQGDDVMAGLYIFVVTAYDDRDRPIGVRRGKFVIIR